MSSKRQKNAGWILPNPVIPDEIPLKKISLCIPDVPEYVAAFWGNMNQLGKWWNWEKSYEAGDTRASQAAELWRYVLYNFRMENCSCGGSSCACGVTTINNVTNITGNEDPPENFDPEDPTTWDPDLNPNTNPSFDSAICTVVKVLMREWETVRVAGEQAECDGEEVDWLTIGGDFSNSIALFAMTYALWTVAPVAIVSVALAAAGSSFAFRAQQFAQAVVSGSNETCPPNRVGNDILDAYACCLYDHFLTQGLSLTSFETMWDQPCPAAIEIFDVLPQLPAAAELMDAAYRNIYKSFTTTSQMYRGFLELLSVVSTVPASQLDDCTTCYDCPPANEFTGEPMFTSPKFTFSPAPTMKVWTDGTTYAEWPSDTTITVQFDDRYCLRGVDLTIKRGATSPNPNKLAMAANGVEVSVNADPQGESAMNMTLPEIVYTRSFTMWIPESGIDGAPTLNVITDDNPVIFIAEAE